MGRIETAAGRRAALVVAAWGCAGAAACASSPVFPAAEQPMVGLVLLEREVIVGSGATDVDLAGTYFSYATLHLPAGAVPAGTRLLVRLLRDVGKTLPGVVVEDLWGYAVQILPATVTFAVPATLTTPNFLYPSRQGGLLFADESEATWQRRGTPALSRDFATLSAPIDGPHLWSFEGATVFEPSGTFVRGDLLCSGVTISTPADAIAFGGGGSYLWTRGLAGATCSITESGQFVISAVNGETVFTPATGAARSYYLSLTDIGFNLSSFVSPSPECGDIGNSSQFFRRVAAAGDGGTAPGDAGCTTDAAPRTDAVVD